MSRAKTILELETAVRWQADQEEAELRHTSEHIRRIINQSAQQLRLQVSSVGDPYFLRSFSGVIKGGAAVDQQNRDRTLPWGSIDSSNIDPEILQVYGIDVSLGGLGRVTSLTHVTFAERLSFQGLGQSSSPCAFFEYNENNIGVLPIPDGDYSFTLWYVPVLPDVMEDGDVMLCGPAGSDEWIVWDCLWKLLARDNYPRLLEVAAATKAELMAAILKQSAHQRVNPSTRRDSRNERRLKFGSSRRLFWTRR